MGARAEITTAVVCNHRRTDSALCFFCTELSINITSFPSLAASYVWLFSHRLIGFFAPFPNGAFNV
jgi:hypothetical protein